MNHSSTAPAPRLVLYGIGQYGSCVARLATQKAWPIVAAFNRAGPKVGRDLGRVVGLDRDLGVVIRDADAGSYQDLDADIGVVAVSNRLETNLPAYERLMGAGLDVLCHGSESYYPQGCNPVLARRIDAMARKQGVTFTGGGIWDLSRIWSGILAAGPCTELRALFHSSVTDAARFGITAIQVSGVGLTLEAFRERLSGDNAILQTYKSVPEHVLVALGYTIRSSTVGSEPVLFESKIRCDALGRDIAPGEAVGTRVVAQIDTHEGVTAKAHFEMRLLREGETEHMLWSVDGMPRTRLVTERDDSVLASATSLFNRIPDVVAAPPGIVLLSQMGPLKHSALR